MNKVKSTLLIVVLVLCAAVVHAKFEGGGFAPSSTGNVKTSAECNAEAYYADGTLCHDTDDDKLYLGTGAAVLQILSATTGQAYDADLDTWSGISPSTDMQAFLGAANDTAARTELGLGTLATQNADNVTITGGSITGITDLTVGGAANVTTLAANVIKTDTSADATLSGTPIIITVYDAASNTPYYFKAYPTK